MSERLKERDVMISAGIWALVALITGLLIKTSIGAIIFIVIFGAIFGVLYVIVMGELGEI